MLLVCILVTQLCSYSSYGQVPGYMGKHFLIEYNASGFPSLGLFNNSSVGKFNFRNNIDAEYVTSIGGSVGVTYKSLSTYASGSNLDTLTFPNSSHMHIKATGYGIYYKNYHHRRGGCIAPLGFYDKFSLIRYTLTASGTLYNADNLLNAQPGQYYLNYNLKNYNAMAISYEYGKHTIFMNRFIFNASAELGFLLAANGASNDVYLKGQIATQAANRVFNHLLFNINIGAGILLF